jgi:hypothetical protein
LPGKRLFGGTTRFVITRIPHRPARQVRKWEHRDIKAKADFQYRTMDRTPGAKEMTRFPVSFRNSVSKNGIRKQARRAAKKGAKPRRNGGHEREDRPRGGGLCQAAPVGVLSALGAFLLIIVLQSCVASMGSVGNGILSAVGGTTYLSGQRH